MNTKTSETSDLAIHLTMIGGVAFATPTPKPELTPTQLKAIEGALIASSEGRTGAVEHHVRKVERKIWPKGFDPHHEARVRAAAEALQARQARGPLPEEPQEPIALPDRERGLGANEVRQWERARETLKNLPPNAGDKKRLAYAKAMREVQDRPAAKADDQWRDQANAETIQLAQARGEEVETTKAGRIHVTSRDSLLNLIKAGKLTDAQAQAGRTCRDAYEIRSKSLGAMNYSDTGRGGRDHEASIAWGIAKANASMMLPFVERFIQLRHISNPVALTMFRNILSERHTIADHGTSQSVRERNTAAFILALDAAVDGIEAWERELERLRAGR